jgi:hypothetical protein
MASLEPQDMSYFDTAPMKCTVSIESPAPVQAVFAVLADHRRWPDWSGMGVTAVEPTSQPESGVGATRTLITGRGALRVQERFIAWEEPAVWAFTGTDCRPKIFQKLVEGFWLEPGDNDHSRITYRMGCEMPMLLNPMSGVMGAMWTQAFERALPNLSAEAVRRHQAANA